MTKNRKAVRSDQIGDQLQAALGAEPESEVIDMTNIEPIKRDDRRKARA